MRNAEYYDEIMIRQAIKVLKPNNELFEIRIIGKGNNRKKSISGYFNNADTLIRAFDTIDPRATNIYFTINKVNEDCYSREQHDCFRQTDSTTHDNEIDSYEWLFVDLDPIRLSEISSTDEELSEAISLADKVYEFMKGYGFNDPVRALSGNGSHLLYKINLANTDENKQLIAKCLVVLASLFNTEKIKIDEVNHNQSRICKLYGTLAQKGANTSKRPHRMSKITFVPEEIKNNSIDVLKRLADELPDSPVEDKKKGKRTTEFNLEDWMFEHGLEPLRKDNGTGCVIYPLANCPFDHSHTNGDSKIFHYSDGAIAFKCHHNSCKKYKWQDLRELLEPGAYDNNYEEDNQRIEEGWKKHKQQYLMVTKTENVEDVKKSLPKLSAISAYDLQTMEFPENYYAVEDMIPQGETVIAAPPKTGKSWLMLDMCLKVARGENFLGFKTNKSDTLYLALEDGDSFEQERLNIVLNGETAPSNFHFVFSNVMPMNEGFLLQLEELLAKFPNVKVIVIDTLQFVKYRQAKSESAYECDYRTGRDLKQFAEQRKIAIVVVTHTTKFNHIEDTMANVSGTNGVTGAADSVTVICKEERTDTKAKLFITGRKVRQTIHDIEFNTQQCVWEYVGITESLNKDERERAEREEMYANSNIRTAVLQIAGKIDTPWRGRASKLIEEAASMGIGLKESNKEVGGFLSRMIGMFMAVDNISISKIGNGTGSTEYEIQPQSDYKNPFE